MPAPWGIFGCTAAPSPWGIFGDDWGTICAVSRPWGIFGSCCVQLPPTLDVPFDVSQSTGDYIVGDELIFTAHAPDDMDGLITTSMALYESAVLVAQMVKTGPLTWEYRLIGVTAGSKSYTVKRTTIAGVTESTSQDITVLGELAPDGITSATLLAWYRNPESILLGGTPVSAGTTPPAVTITGTLTNQDLDIYITIPVGGARGTATYSVSVTGVGGAAFQTGTTAATVALGTTGITINFPVGTYNVNNTYHFVCSGWNDKTGNAHNFSNVTAGTRPFVHVNQQGGKTSQVYDANDLLNCTTTLANTCAGNGINTAFTVITVLTIGVLPTGADIKELYTMGNTGSLSRCDAFIGSASWGIRRRDNSANDSTITSIVPSFGGFIVHIWRFDGTNSTVEINGVDIIGGDSEFDVPGLNACAAALTLNNVSLAAQKTSAGTVNFLGNPADIYEQAYYSGAISTSELYRLRPYFAAVV